MADVNGSHERRLYSKLTQRGGSAELQDLAAIRDALQEARATEAYRLGLEHGQVLTELLADRDKYKRVLEAIGLFASQGLDAGTSQGAVQWARHLEQIAARAKEVLG